MNLPYLVNVNKLIRKKIVYLYDITFWSHNEKLKSTSSVFLVIEKSIKTIENQHPKSTTQN